MPDVAGGCLCGKLRFDAEGEPDRVGICHCQDCRKHHGAAFYASAIYPADRVRLSGQFGEYQGRCFCPLCGSSVFGRSGDEIELYLGAMDDAGRFVPDYELWTIRRLAWLPEFPGTVRHLRDETG